jgi:hypothetical protein
MGILFGTTALMAADLSAVASAKAEPVPLAQSLVRRSLGEVGYGHRDFVPTPERPVYFRQTCGWYPGATPPLEWWEGTPTTRKVAGVFGNPPQHKEIDALDFGDTTTKNIRWKVPVPGWSLSHPIVVGQRVFAVGEPDFVTCWDLDTGKQLWQRRIMPLWCDGLPEEKAVAGQKVLDLARAFLYIGTRRAVAGDQPGNLFNDGWNQDGTPRNSDHAAFLAEKRAMAQKLLDVFEPHRREVEDFGDAALLAALDKDLEILRRFQTVSDLAALQALMNEKMPGAHTPLRPLHLVAACLSVLQVDIGGSWWGYVGTADSTLASDGKCIYGVFDQGQVFCLDLEGKTVWVQREKGWHDNRGTFHRSPLLCGDLLLVRNMTEIKGKGRLMRALETATGKVRWEAPLAGSNYLVPRLMRLHGADGTPVDVLIGDAPQDKDQGMAILRVADGKLLGHLPRHDCGRGASMAVFGQQVTWTSLSDTGGGPSCSYRLRLDGPDTVVAEKVFVLGETEKKERIFYNQDNFPTVAGNAWLYRNQLFDATTGAAISKLPVPVGDLGVIAGHYLIGMSGGFNDGLYGRGGPGARGRDDGRISCSFTVLDIQDPAKPVVVAQNNLLGYAEPAADLIVSTYFKDFNPLDFAGCYRGSASYFALMSGPVPHGDKLLIQSSAYLYCIGPGPDSGPQVGGP